MKQQPPKSASKDHTHAARPHETAAKHHEEGQHEKASHHAHLAHAHGVYATEHQGHTAKKHIETHGSK